MNKAPGLPPTNQDGAELNEKYVPFNDLKGHRDFGKFKGEKYSAMVPGDIYQSGENKDVIIRGICAKDHRHSTLIDETTEALHKFSVEVKKDFEELENLFSVKVSPTLFVEGKTENGFNELWAVTKRVEGFTLNSIPKDVFLKEKDVLSKVLENHFNALFNYIDVKYTQKKKIMTDIFHNEQYVYGNLKDSDEQFIYLIDPEPAYADIEKLTEINYYLEWIVSIHECLCYLREVSENYKIPFTNVKMQAKKMYESLKQKMDNKMDNVENPVFLQSVIDEMEEMLG